MSSEDKTRQSSPDGSRATGKRARGWMRWLGGTSRRAEPAPQQAPAGLDQIRVTTLPALLDPSKLPDGVVELVIDDFEDPSRQLFDINNGHITLVDPGQCMPWASISGPPTAWARALGPEGDAAGLQLTGDTQLARQVLAALPQPD